MANGSLCSNTFSIQQALGHTFRNVLSSRKRGDDEHGATNTMEAMVASLTGNLDSAALVRGVEWGRRCYYANSVVVARTGRGFASDKELQSGTASAEVGGAVERYERADEDTAGGPMVPGPGACARGTRTSSTTGVCGQASDGLGDDIRPMRKRLCPEARKWDGADSRV